MVAEYYYDKWLHRFMEQSRFMASWSKDQSTKVGSIIVNDQKSVLTTGYNGIPRGVHDGFDESRRNVERPYKYFFYEHAERNAIFNAARNGLSVEGGILFCWPLAPCADCARAIIQSGIRVVIHPLADVERWNESCDAANLMFKESNTTIINPIQDTSGQWVLENKYPFDQIRKWESIFS